MIHITDQRCSCCYCGWDGTVGGLEGDVDGNGAMGCPWCGAIVYVIAPPLPWPVRFRYWLLNFRYWLRDSFLEMFY